eukprot:SAG11_NODE_1300_length_5261_cov_8.900232_9_plen_145_part_00
MQSRTLCSGSARSWLAACCNLGCSASWLTAGKVLLSAGKRTLASGSAAKKAAVCCLAWAISSTGKMSASTSQPSPRHWLTCAELSGSLALLPVPPPHGWGGCHVVWKASIIAAARITHRGRSAHGRLGIPSAMPVPQGTSAAVH